MSAIDQCTVLVCSFVTASACTRRRASDRVGPGVRVRAGGVQRRGCAPARTRGGGEPIPRGAACPGVITWPSRPRSGRGWARCPRWCCSRPWRMPTRRTGTSSPPEGQAQGPQLGAPRFRQAGSAVDPVHEAARFGVTWPGRLRLRGWGRAGALVPGAARRPVSVTVTVDPGRYHAWFVVDVPDPPPLPVVQPQSRDRPGPDALGGGVRRRGTRRTRIGRKASTEARRSEREKARRQKGRPQLAATRPEGRGATAGSGHPAGLAAQAGVQRRSGEPSGLRRRRGGVRNAPGPGRAVRARRRLVDVPGELIPRGRRHGRRLPWSSGGFPLHPGLLGVRGHRRG